MAQVKIELLHGGIDKLLKSAEISSFLGNIANNTAAKCGAGYEADEYMTPSRVVCSVYTSDEEAKRDNIENNTLLKAVSG